ncbi:hypothetical protein AB0L13_47610 [Saccharopolyspora shandongensis]|uniref:hypothetical protein n=1 Tax=Saccharopolyspora shandongensis TaxID=418495 RepID=UPI00343F9BEB
MQALVLRLTKETHRGYRRLHDELLVLGVKVAASTVWEILQAAGINPAPNATPAHGPTSCAPRPTPCRLAKSLVIGSFSLPASIGLAPAGSR